jgi:LPPG:FO 2-phospho-L-lactate transferase
VPERVAALAGGVGAARLVRGMARLLPADRLSVIVNTADDEEFYGLYISPDLATIVYTLAGVAPRGRGWGIAGDSRRTLAALGRFFPKAWFQLGDRDLATHVYRTEALARGRTLAEVTAAIARAYRVRSRVLPMSNERVRTFVRIAGGRELSFQEYFVRRRARDRVKGITYRGLSAAKAAPRVLASIRRADLLVLPPSNPFTSIRPILGVSGIGRAVAGRRAPLVAVSPVAGGRAIRGPLGDMLRAARLPVSPVGIASLYRGLLDGMVIDSRDRSARRDLERSGIAVAETDVHMNTMAKSVAVARIALDLARSLRSR